MQRLNPGNNSLREIPIKRDGRGPPVQFRLTTKLTNVVGISFIFVTSFGRYPCHRWKCIFVSNFSVHRFRILTVRSPRSVTALSAAHFRSQQPGALLYIARSPTFSVSCANGVTVTNSFRSHYLAFPISHSSSFEFLLRKYKIYFEPH